MDDAEILGHRKLSLAEMIRVCRYAAHREQGSQQALVEGGYREAPDPEAAWRIEVLDQTANFLERFEKHFGDFKRWLADRTYRRR